MFKSIIVLLIMFCQHYCTAQSGRLVQKNIITQSTIGTNGQLLSVNGYKRSRIITTTDPVVFSIPSGVSQIFIEQWGAGGGGALGGGGASGAMVEYTFDVTDLISITVDNGIGGTGASSETGNGTSGQASSIQFGVYTYTVTGGGGAGQYSPGLAFLPPTYTPGVNARLLSFNCLPGNTGNVLTLNNAPMRIGGSGGDSPFQKAKGGSGGTWSKDGNNVITHYSSATPGIAGSGGGGGIVNTGPATYVYGTNGGNGITIIWW